MTKDERIQNERLRLAALFTDLERDQFYIVLGLIDQAAFLRVTLEDIQAETTATDEYKNGKNQHGQKISATLQAYNQTEKVYQKLIIQLMKYLPYVQHTKYRVPGADEHTMLAFKNFTESRDIDYYLSEEFNEKLQADRAKALELMLAGN